MRWLWSLAIWFILATTVIAGAGFAADGPPKGAPEHFGTEPSRVGDSGVYKTALVMVYGDQGHWIDLEARFAFERALDAPWVVDDQVTSTRSFVAEWTNEPFEFLFAPLLGIPMPSCFADFQDPAFMYDPSFAASPQGMTAPTFDPSDLQACGDEMSSWAQQFESQYADAWFEETHLVDAGGWRVTHHDGPDPVALTQQAGDASAFLGGLADGAWTIPSDVDGPCGFQHSLQGRSVDLWQPIVVHGLCPPAMALGIAETTPLDGPVTLRVSGESTVGDWETLVFSHEKDADLLRLWFANEVPYPVRILSEVDVLGKDAHLSDVRFYILQELIEFEAGEETPAPGPDESLAIARSGRSLWGPTDHGVDHPDPFSLAFLRTLGYPDSPVAAWLEDHDGAVDTAVYGDGWLFTLTDGESGLLVDARGGGLNTTEFIASRPTPSQQPDRLPRIESLAAAHGSFGAMTGWSYFACNGCAHIMIGEHPAWSDRLDVTVWDEQGVLIGRGQDAEAFPAPRSADHAWFPDQAGRAWGWSVAGAGVWHWPEPKTAAGAAAATGLVGLVYLIWPAIKGAVPLFSRIKGEDLLDHPVRNDIWSAIQASPGIHFQALVRDVGKGRGTMEHHIRKMVAADMLIEKTGTGFTCYFPKGQVDRRLMAAAPALKSSGAKQLLQAIHAQPGAAAIDLAERLGMAPSTVNYHLKKLTQAELVEGQRVGRQIMLRATPLGDQALGTLLT